MPWASTNRIFVQGPRPAIERLFEAITPSDAERALHGTTIMDFERILPSPPYPADPILPNEATAWQRLIFYLQDWWSGACAAREIARREHNLWLEENWGSCGNAWDTVGGREGDSLIFTTPNAPPIPLMRTLSKQFPELYLTFEFVSQSDGQTGRCDFLNGEGQMVYFEQNSPERNDLLRRLGQEDMICDGSGEQIADEHEAAASDPS